MKNRAIMFAALLTVGVLTSAAATAKPKDAISPAQAAQQTCEAEKRADRDAFSQTYGNSGMGKCVAEGRSEAKDTIATSTQDCREQRGRSDRSRSAFKRAYASPSGNSAFKRCVSSEVRSDRRQSHSEFKNAAQECREERGYTDESRAAFEEKYGTKKGDMPLYRPQPQNAFGKCVSSKVSQSKNA
jgi:hypothetical protein